VISGKVKQESFAASAEIKPISGDRNLQDWKMTDSRKNGGGKCTTSNDGRCRIGGICRTGNDGQEFG